MVLSVSSSFFLSRKGFYFQVAENRCWSCGLACESNQDLQNHLHKVARPEEIKPLWNNDMYLKPFLSDDPLLYSFSEDEDIDDEDTMDREELMTSVKNIEEICIDDELRGENLAFDTLDNRLDGGSSSGKCDVKGLDSRDLDGMTKDKKLRAYFPNRAAKDVKNINEDYFGSYSSFGIHREMLSDKAWGFGQFII